MADTLPPKKATNFKSYLHDDLLIPILTRLPAKTLIEFLTVSKSWYALITAPNFISAHQHHHHHKPLLLYFDSEFLCSILPHRRTRLLGPSNSALVGSSNGLVCLFNRDATISLWNPGIGKHLDFDPIPIPYREDRQLSMGFGFDSSTNDFKAVAISYFSSITLSTSPRPHPQTCVFSLNSGAWRMVEFPAGSWDDLSGISKPIFIYGVIHWIIFHGRVIDYDEREPGAVVYADSILTFDVGSECFGNQGLPFGLGHAMSDKLCLTVVDNSLALVQHELSEYRVWVMIKENGAKASWTQIYRIRAPPHSTWFHGWKSIRKPRCLLLHLSETWLCWTRKLPLLLGLVPILRLFGACLSILQAWLCWTSFHGRRTRITGLGEQLQVQWVTCILVGLF